MPGHQIAHRNIAQLNIAEFKHPPESPQVADFIDNIERINTIAESSPGFVWRYQAPVGDAKEIELFGANHAVNMSVWESLDALKAFVYRADHLTIMKRRQEWFYAAKTAHMVLWWIKPGEIPTLDEANNKLQLLRSQGPTAAAFSFHNVVLSNQD